MINFILVFNFGSGNNKDLENFKKNYQFKLVEQLDNGQWLERTVYKPIPCSYIVNHGTFSTLETSRAYSKLTESEVIDIDIDIDIDINNTEVNALVVANNNVPVIANII